MKTGMKRLLRAWHCGAATSARRQLRIWYQTVLGAELQSAECKQLDCVLSNLFGYHLLQLGCPMELDLLAHSRIKHRMVLETDNSVKQSDCMQGTERCLGMAHQLPFANDSLDVLVLPHTLEFEAEPHQLLREVDRTLIPEGHVVILGFNPWSLWGLVRLFLGWRHQPPWCGHFFSTTRVKDWLALLGFDTVLVQGYFYRPPIQHSGLLERMKLLEYSGSRWWSVFGGGYVLVAKKRVTTLTPIKPRWHSKRRLLGGGLAEPTANRSTHHE